MGDITRIHPLLQTASGGGGGDGDYHETFTFNAAVTTVGEAVCVDPDDPSQLTLADADDASKMPCIGLVSEFTAGHEGYIEARPGVTITSADYAFDAGSSIYLATSGNLTDTPDPDANGGSQQIGVAMTATKLLIQIGPLIRF